MAILRFYLKSLRAVIGGDLGFTLEHMDSAGDCRAITDPVIKQDSSADIHPFSAILGFGGRGESPLIEYPNDR